MPKLICAIVLCFNLFISNSFADDEHKPLLPKMDREQCDRRCKDVFQADLGYRERFKDKDKCSCFTKKGDFLGETSMQYPKGEIPSPDGIVCGENLKEYPNCKSAEADSTRCLHEGHCGACSNVHDIDIYKKTANTLTGISKKCAMKQVFFGEKIGTRCLNKDVGLTPACTKCWVDNVSCDALHCKKICMKHSKDPRNINGKLNPCLQCDEDYCGSMFIKCAGANRRRSGIVSDIDRGAQVWIPDSDKNDRSEKILFDSLPRDATPQGLTRDEGSNAGNI